MMRLLTGPAGSGKTFRVLSEFREALAAGAGARLLVPTATLQQHLQNELARQGMVLRANAVSTLARFASELAPQATAVSNEFFHLMVAGAVRSVGAPQFDKVREMPGFHSRLAATIQDLDSAGATPEDLAAVRRELAPFRDAVAAVWSNVRLQMRSRKLVTRGEMLRGITTGLESKALPERIWIDGFAQLSGPEIELIRALGARSALTMTLPDEGIPGDLKSRLLEAGFVEERLSGGRSPAVSVAVPESIERETEEIARQIVAGHAGGTPFREIGVIVRQPAKYEPVLRTAFERFGIPARFYFGEKLESHPAARLMAETVEALLNGWEHERVLALLRLAPEVRSTNALDEFDVELREQLPGCGLQSLVALAGARRQVSRLLQALEGLNVWADSMVTPVEWADRVSSLPRLFHQGVLLGDKPSDKASRDEALRYRGRAAGFQAFAEAMAQTAEWFATETGSMGLAEFWRVAKALIALKTVSAEHRGRNVVHVVSAYEARQWDFSAVFVCGLVEKDFPAQIGRDPFLSDAALRDLAARSGARVRTTADREEEERNLFAAIRVRARDRLVLTYPRVDGRGQRTLPSIFLKDMTAMKVDVAVRPTLPAPVSEWMQPSWLRSEDLLAQMTAQHTTFSVTSLESLLQCPFQFFSNRILKIREGPLRPEDRLNFLLQGNIVHETLKEWFADRPALEPLFDRVYARICADNHVQQGYRSERARRMMLLVLNRFAAMTQAQPRAVESLVEQLFRFPVDPDLIVNGRMDRIDKLPDGRALVIDYKYSSAANTKSKVEDEAKLQGPLYALALREQFGIEPAGMMYVSLKGEKPEVFGWGDGEWAARPLTEELMQGSVERVRSAVGEFRSGTIHPRPLNADPCRYCDYKDACRVKEQTASIPVTGLPAGA